MKQSRSRRVKLLKVYQENNKKIFLKSDHTGEQENILYCLNAFAALLHRRRQCTVQVGAGTFGFVVGCKTSINKSGSKAEIKTKTKRFIYSISTGGSTQNDRRAISACNAKLLKHSDSNVCEKDKRRDVGELFGQFDNQQVDKRLKSFS